MPARRADRVAQPDVRCSFPGALTSPRRFVVNESMLSVCKIQPSGIETSPLAKLGPYSRFAHHATCGRCDHHLLRPFGLALCLGCTCMYSGIGMTLLCIAALGLPREFTGGVALFGTGFVGCLPTLLRPFFIGERTRFPRDSYSVPASR